MSPDGTAIGRRGETDLRALREFEWQKPAEVAELLLRTALDAADRLYPAERDRIYAALVADLRRRQLRQ